MGIPKCPSLAADVIIEVDRRIVLIERKNFPFGWALPGGFVEVGEPVEETAVREAFEETSLAVELTALLGVYSRPDRDPRGHTVTVVYVGRAQGAPKAGDDAGNAALYSLEDLPSPLAFDHAQVVADYREFLRTGRIPVPACPPRSKN
jgi:8-oxo-dGTP diphosphatase